MSRIPPEGPSWSLSLEPHRERLRLLAKGALGPALGAKIDPSDLVQETFLHAEEARLSFRGKNEAELLSWLRSILANVVANTVRRYIGTEARDLRREQPIEPPGSQSRADGRQPFAPIATPSEFALRSEERSELVRKLMALPSDYREVILLRHLEALPFAEVAERMGRSVDSVQKLWVRALQALKSALEAPP